MNVYQAKNKCTILHHTLEKQGEVLTRKKVAKLEQKSKRNKEIRPLKGKYFLK